MRMKLFPVVWFSFAKICVHLRFSKDLKLCGTPCHSVVKHI